MPIQALDRDDSSDVALLDDEGTEGGGAGSAGACQEGAPACPPMQDAQAMSHKDSRSRRASTRGHREAIGEGALPPIRQALEAFERALPKLRKKHRGQWVGFSDNGLEAISAKKEGVIDVCAGKGLTAGQFVARLVK